MTVHHLGEQRYAGFNERGQQLLIDASPLAVGVRPTEALLAALASCTAYDVVAVMNKKKTPLSRYRVEVEGERAGEHPRRFTRITLRHVAWGQGVSEEALTRAAQLSHEKYCSVAATLNAEIALEVCLERPETAVH